MSELKPCPFCGYEANLDGNGTLHYVKCARCGSVGVRSIDKDVVIEAWNTRADDYKQAAEYWQRMYEESFTERTCKVEGSYTDNWEYQTWGFELSCGHDVPMLFNEPPNYCPVCGAKVVSE